MTSVPNRFHSIDLMRFILASVVAINHILFQEINPRATLLPSKFAVEIFFIISGYVIAPQVVFVAKNLELRNIYVFLSRRVLRTIPAFLFALVLTCTILNSWPSSLKVLLLDFFFSIPTSDSFAISWSLAVEEYSYLGVTAFLIFSLLIPKAYRGLSMVWFLGFAIAFSFLVRYSFNGSEELERIGTIFRVDSLVYGAIIWRYCRKGNLLLGVACVITGGILSVILGSPFSTFGYGLPPILISAGCFLMVLKLEAFFERLIWLQKLCRQLGSLSYGIYLVHLPILYGLSTVFSGPVLMIVAFITIVMFSALVREFIEEPCLSVRPTYIEHLTKDFPR